MSSPRPPSSAPRSLVVAALLVASCSAPKPDLCWGGVINENDVCTAKCDPAKCLPGNTCVGNACTLICTSHLQCGDVSGQRCLPGHQDDTDAGIMLCQAFDGGGVGVACPLGTECAAPLRCLSGGPADATAYCTGDCAADADCPSGFECGFQRDPHKVCGPDGGTLGKALCGTTTEACLEPSAITADSPYVAATYCLQRKTCLRRSTCASCTEDLDCSLSRQRCVGFGAAKVCAPDCNTNTDCEADKHCVAGSCLPWYGACAGAGFCAPCRFDLDCGPDFSCQQLHGAEKSCLNLRFPDACTTSNDCPVAPSGRHGFCLDESVGLAPGDSAYHRCYAPYTASTNAFSCYYAPTAQMPWPDAG